MSECLLAGSLVSWLKTKDVGKSVLSIGYVVYSKDLGIILVSWVKKMWVRNSSIVLRS